MTRVRAACLALVLDLLPIAAARAEEPPLPALNADIAQTSISGISSGAFMAVQFGVAWSSIVVGVGAIAGGPYGCSEGSASQALSTCMGGTPAPNLATLLRRTDEWRRGGSIDDTASISRQRIYLFSGYNDSVVARSVTNALQAFYAHFHPASLFYQTAIGAGHAQVTLAYGGGCTDNGGHFINWCGYDQAGVVLQHIYGALNPRNGGILGGQIITFRQPADDSLDNKGFAYIPRSCAAHAPCRVHIALHGCLQSFGDIGEAFIRHAGYNEWADDNHIIVLYPQIRRLGLRNPQSCWDWWGYLDANPMNSPSYLLKAGRQIGAIKTMLDQITRGHVAAGGGGAPSSTALVVDVSDTGIDLAWSALSGATYYHVWRAAPGEASFREIAAVAGLSYGDVGLKPGEIYRYRVSADGTNQTSDVIVQRTRSRVPRCLEPGTCPVR